MANQDTFSTLIAPETLRARYPLTNEEASHIASSRDTVRAILEGRDPRFLVITGPCSIHDPEAAYEYATRLKALQEACRDTLFIVMRVYPEKPRTLLGWKGFINDPERDGSFHIEKGLDATRKLMHRLVQLGMPIATEILTPLMPAYFADMITWVAIGARTSESPVHREMASGLPMPVGFKNATDGTLRHAANAIQAARQPHHTICVMPDGRCGIQHTSGNPACHLVLRGSDQGPNFDLPFIEEAQQTLEQLGVSPTRLIVDCSHGNSQKNPFKQPDVLDALLAQKEMGHKSVAGIMMESFLEDGAQDLANEPLRYGQSITDACLGWDKTASMLEKAHTRLMALQSAQ